MPSRSGQAWMSLHLPRPPAGVVQVGAPPPPPWTRPSSPLLPRPVLIPEFQNDHLCLFFIKANIVSAIMIYFQYKILGKIWKYCFFMSDGFNLEMPTIYGVSLIF